MAFKERGEDSFEASCVWCEFARIDVILAVELGLYDWVSFWSRDNMSRLAFDTYDRVLGYDKLIGVIWISEDRRKVNGWCNVSHQVQVVIRVQRLG